MMSPIIDAGVRPVAKVVNGFTSDSQAVAITLGIIFVVILILPPLFRHFGWAHRHDDRRP